MTYFKLFSNCIAVKGAARSVVCDIQRKDMFYIPNGLYDFLDECKTKPFDVIIEEYDDPQSVHTLLNNLLENELGFWTDSPDLFPDISESWDVPSEITNAIIDFNASSTHNIPYILGQLYELGCKHLEFRFYDEVEKDFFEEILYWINYWDFLSAEFVIKYNEDIENDYYLGIEDFTAKIKTITIHSAPVDEIVRMGGGYKGGTPMGNLVTVAQVINSNSHCGNISSLYFVYNNVKAFIESANYNTCLNKKIGIDVDGAVKNCPTLEKCYGNIKDHSLKNILQQTEIKTLWNITKDQVSICRDCEHRRVCTDCRAILVNPSDPLSKPLKCSYNPYKMVWEN